jgi:hypothetical protein
VKQSLRHSRTGAVQNVRSFGSPQLLRKCGCGASAFSVGECEACKKKLLQRKTGGVSSPTTAPPLVHEVLNSPGRPLDPETRSFFEWRFQHDFGRVRVHTDEKAAESARAVNALAYTVGEQVVFDFGHFSPQTGPGRNLLAHELAHVVQQQGSYSSGSKLAIAEVEAPAEREADRIAGSVNRRVPHSGPARSSARLMRKLRVDKPSQKIPDPTGQGLKQTNAEAVEGYLKIMAEGSGVKVDRSSGKVDVDTAYCPGFLGGLVGGAKFGYGLFSGIPLLGPVLGAVAGVVGGLIGGIAGLFGSDSSGAKSSSTPTGSTCLCDHLQGKQTWTIEINDEFPDSKFPHPATLTNRVVVFSPNNQKIAGAATVSGALENAQPWLLLAHELCGHAWLDIKGQDENKTGPAYATRDAQTGNYKISNPESLGKDKPAPHHERSVERENLIRKEHGMGPRGWRLKDPYCGESFLRDRSNPQGPPQWFPDTTYQGFNTLLEQCRYLRDQLPVSKNKKYRIEEAIP